MSLRGGAPSPLGTTTKQSRVQRANSGIAALRSTAFRFARNDNTEFVAFARLP